MKLDLKQVGADHPKYATHRANLAVVQEAQKDLIAAEQGYVEAVRVYEQVLGRLGHPNLIDTYANLGSLLVKTGNFASAKDYLCKALGLNRAAARRRTTRWSATITRTSAASTTRPATTRRRASSSTRPWRSTWRTSSASACRGSIRTSTKREIWLKRAGC